MVVRESSSARSRAACLSLKKAWAFSERVVSSDWRCGKVGLLKAGHALLQGIGPAPMFRRSIHMFLEHRLLNLWGVFFYQLLNFLLTIRLWTMVAGKRINSHFNARSSSPSRSVSATICVWVGWLATPPPFRWLAQARRE